MPNIKFSYLYRDSANYKNYGSIVFDNSINIGLFNVENIIQSKLIDQTWFYASRWGVPNLFFSSTNIEVDPTWHEFDSIVYTDKTSMIVLSDFLEAIN